MITIHYCGSFGLAANSNCPSLGSSTVQGKICMWLSFPSGTQDHPQQQYPHIQLLHSETPFYITGILLAADVGSRNTAQPLSAD